MLNKIFNGDCLEMMKDLPDNSVDLICTDPPYCVGATSSGVKSSFTDFSLIIPFFKELFAQWQRILKIGGHLYICTDWRTYPVLYPVLMNYFKVRNLIVWDYEWIKAGCYYRPTHELIMFATHGKTDRKIPRDCSDIWRVKTINYTKPDKMHPSEKPVALFEKMIKNSSVEGETVLDCFAGSGTAAVAAINTGRKFICYELDEKYFDVACYRVQKAILDKSQLKLF